MTTPPLNASGPSAAACPDPKRPGPLFVAAVHLGPHPLQLLDQPGDLA